jgi:hypothetical protein
MMRMGGVGARILLDPGRYIVTSGTTKIMFQVIQWRLQYVPADTVGERQDPGYTERVGETPSRHA